MHRGRITSAETRTIIRMRAGCGRFNRFRAEILRSTYALQIDADHFACRCFDAAILKCIRLGLYPVEVKRYAKFLGIVRTAAFGAELQPLRAGRIAAAAWVELAFAVSGCGFVLHRAFNAAVVAHPADAQTRHAQELLARGIDICASPGASQIRPRRHWCCGGCCCSGSLIRSRRRRRVGPRCRRCG